MSKRVLSPAEKDSYIEFLESELSALDTQNIKLLIVELDEFSGVLAKDLKMIRTGNKSECILITDEKSLVTDTVIKLVEKISGFKAVSDLAKSLIPPTHEMLEEKLVESNEGKLKRLNAFERRILEKNK